MPDKRFATEQFGLVVLEEAHYANGATAVQLFSAFDGEPIATLSVNLVGKSDKLPPKCFYAKTYSENSLIARDAAQSGWFRARHDLPPAVAGWEICVAWELLDEVGPPFTDAELEEEGL